MHHQSVALMISAALAVLAMCGSAQAADFGGPRGPVIDPDAYTHRAPFPAGGWDGPYFGLTYGYADGSTQVSGASGQFESDQSGGIGSLFGGYNLQFANVVIGLEADIGSGDFESAERGVRSELDLFGSLRGRAGYLLTPDFMIYGTAGLAWADFDFQAAGGRSTSETFQGYQVGAGTELRFADPWALRLEYVYTDFGAETGRHGGFANNYEPGFHTVRAGLSLQF